MPFLQGAVVLVGILCLANVTLIVALARRVRRHDERLAAGAGFQGATPLMPVGTKVSEFTAVTVSGERRTLAAADGTRSLVGLFTPSCLPCREERPAFADLARTMPGGPGQVLAVISGPQNAAMEFAAELDGVASVVIEPPDGPVGAAFGVSARPAFFLIDDGRVKASGRKVRVLDVVPA